MEEVDSTPSSLPDHLWIKIFETGIDKSKFDIKDLSSLSISCKNFNKLSEEDILWSTLLTLDFPSKPHHLLGSSCSFPSKKALYRNSLHSHLKRKRTCIERQVEKDEHRLGLITDRMKRVRESVKEMKPEMDEMSADLQKLIDGRMQTRSARKRSDALKGRHDRLIAKVGRVDELLGVLVDIINPRESRADGVAVSYQASLAFAAPSGSPSSSGPSSSTPAGSSPYVDALVYLEMAIHDLSSDQQELIRQQLVPSFIDDLLHRRQEHRKELDVLTRRLVPFSTDSHPIEIGNDDEAAIKAAEADGNSDLEAA